MNPNQQALHLMFTEAVIRFEESVREATQALYQSPLDKTKTPARHYLETIDNVETWRAALLDAYTAALVQQ